MTSITSNAKNKVNNTLQGSNSNLADLGTKIQNSYLVSAVVSEIRPSGDAILYTSHGIVRTPNTLNAAQNDNVLVRISYNEEGEIEANMIEISSNIIKKPKPDSSLMRYLGNIISGTKNINQLPASFSYIAPNRNILLYGNIKVGSPISINIIEPSEADNYPNLILGSVISNEKDMLLVNSPIGIININAKSKMHPGQKVLFQIISRYDEENNLVIKEQISLLMQNIIKNIRTFKELLQIKNNLNDKASYQRMIRLLSKSHDSAILAKIFHQNINIPASEVSKWIDKDIVAPFEASSRNNVFKKSLHSVLQIKDILITKQILEASLLNEVKIKIPDSDKEAKVKIMHDNNILSFTMDVSHQMFGEVTIHGILEYNIHSQNLSNITLNMKYTEKFPSKLADEIRLLFTDHVSMSNINGSINFQFIVYLVSKTFLSSLLGLPKTSGLGIENNFVSTSLILTIFDIVTSITFPSGSSIMICFKNSGLLLSIIEINLSVGL
ncbi:MAG UNVERIFIED_CONTAM: hypothetical protein LVQ98_02915 [Rickettsiaceae bacterium]